MKLLVCGGRKYADRRKVFETLTLMEPEVIIHGDATGADTLADEWGIAAGVPRWVYPAEWYHNGRVDLNAGRKRNKLMLMAGPDIVLAFPGGSGTAHMKSIAKKAGVKVIEIK